MKDKDLYNMELHDYREMDNITGIIRVPGGWLYRTILENGTGGYELSICFVPYHNEFQIVPKAE